MVIVRISPSAFAGKAYFAVRSRSTYFATVGDQTLCLTCKDEVTPQRCGVKYV
jgi:hypothetical protein